MGKEGVRRRTGCRLRDPLRPPFRLQTGVGLASRDRRPGVSPRPVHRRPGRWLSLIHIFLPAGTAVCPYCGARQYVPGYPQKSKVAAGVLGILLGGFGAHNFYLGYTGKAVLQLVLTLCSCGIASLWGFIEGILILTGSIGTDANGVPLSN